MGAGHKKSRKERPERPRRAGCLCLRNEDSSERGTVRTRGGLGKGSLGRKIHLEDHRAVEATGIPGSSAPSPGWGFCLAGTP